MRVLVTGGAGFIGHHVVQAIIHRTDWDITILDRLDCSGNLNRLAEIGVKRARFVFHDLRAEINEQLASQIGPHDYILHIAAATHVDRSITDPMSFVMDNVVATCNMLNFARSYSCKKFLYFSTDEVFGPAPGQTAYKEWDRYRSSNPYAATKAGGEELTIAFHNTYGVPAFVTHTMNVIGPRQHYEKYVPGTLRKIIMGETVLIHSDSTKTQPGSRFYIDARDVADAVLFLLNTATPGEKYNIVGEREIDNLALAKLIEYEAGLPMNAELVSWHGSRPGHDLRYGLSGEKLRGMGWKPKLSIEESISQIVSWYLANHSWLGLPSEHVNDAIVRSGRPPLVRSSVAINV